MASRRGLERPVEESSSIKTPPSRETVPLRVSSLEVEFLLPVLFPSPRQLLSELVGRYPGGRACLPEESHVPRSLSHQVPENIVIVYFLSTRGLEPGGHPEQVLLEILGDRNCRSCHCLNSYN